MMSVISNKSKETNTHTLAVICPPTMSNEGITALLAAEMKGDREEWKISDRY